MAFLHTSSSEACKSELDLFSLPPTQTSIENSYWTEYKPISALTNNSPIEFTVPGNSDEYLDLPHTLLYLKVSFQLPAATVLNEEATAASVNTGPVNNTLHSLFSQVDVSLNRTPVSPPNSAYAYRSYIETLLNYGPAAKASHLTSVLWYTDTVGKLEHLTENDGLNKRKNFFKIGNPIDLIGHIHHDLFNQDKLLLNGVEMSIRFVQSRDSFPLMDPTGLYHIQILEATLMIRRVKVSADVLIRNEKILSTTTAKYPITRVQVKSAVINSGIDGTTLDNITLGQIGRRYIIGFVKNKAFNGDRALNPYNFDHFNINFLSLSVNGVQVPSRQLQPNFTSGLYVEAYHALFSGTGIHFLNQGNCISRDAFKKGYCLFAFDLTPDLSANCSSHFNLIRHGSVRIDVKFSQALTDNINCLVYVEYDNLLEIDSARQRIVDFTA